MASESSEKAVAIATSMINLVISAIVNKDEDLLKDVSRIVENMVDFDPEQTLKVFKAALIIAAETIINMEEKTDGNHQE